MTLKGVLGKNGEFSISVRHKYLTVNHWWNKLSTKRISEFPPPSSFLFSLDWFYAAAVSRESAGSASFFNKNILWVKHELGVGNCRIIRIHVLILFCLMRTKWDQLVVYVIKMVTFCEYKDTFCLCAEYKQGCLGVWLRVGEMHNAVSYSGSCLSWVKISNSMP